MNTIYKGAARVLIWLGRADDENAALAFDLIHTIYDRNPTAIDLHTFEFPPDHDLTARGLPPRSSRKWDALRSMSNLPYFTRAWVVQELIAASKARVLWGESEIEWPLFCCVLEWLVQNGCGFLDPQGRPSLNFVNLHYMLPVHEDTNLLEWLSKTRGKEATDARDRVHAVLGLAEDVQTDIPQAIKADYDKSEADLYRNVARYCIRRHKNLDILSYNLHNASRPGDHSSWAPVWQKPRPDLDPLGDFVTFNFRAGREREASYEDTGEPSLLFLQGMKIDTVATGCVAFGHNQCNNGQISIPIVDAWRYTRARFDEPYQAQPHASLIWAFIRTLMADRRFSTFPNFSATPATETSVLPFANYVTKHLLAFLTEPAVLRQMKQCPRDILHCVEAASGRGTSLFPKQNQEASNPGEGSRWCKQQAKNCHPDNDLAAEAAAAHLEPLLHCPGDHQLFQASFEFFSPGRRFYTTKNGSMGLGPSAMRGGDIICVLFGGTVPYILRPIAGGEYSFVGDCYIDGFMNGEAIQKLEAAEIAAEWFPLR